MQHATILGLRLIGYCVHHILILEPVKGKRKCSDWLSLGHVTSLGVERGGENLTSFSLRGVGKRVSMEHQDVVTQRVGYAGEKKPQNNSCALLKEISRAQGRIRRGRSGNQQAQG